MSGVDLNRNEETHHPGGDLWGMISNNPTPYIYRGAHRFIPWGGLVAMAVRSAGLRGAVDRDQERSTCG